MQPQPTAPRARRGIVIAATSLLTASLLTSGGIPAFAKSLDDYATWDDVVAAQDDVDKQNALIDEIKSQIEQLNDQVTQAEAASASANDAYATAQRATTEQSETAYGLEQQANAANAEADRAETEAAGYIAAVSSRVTLDPTLQLLTNPGDAQDFLMGMSTLSQLGTQSGASYEQAIAARNNAKQLGEQAQAALNKLQQLESQAQEQYQAAVDAQLALQQTRDEKTERGAELEAMLIPLQEHRKVVEADYREGERLREEERQRIAEEQRKAAAAAAATAASTGNIAPSSSGYYPPLGYSVSITDTYGMRFHPVYKYWKLHNGTDFVVSNGVTCGAPIYAVASGTVTLASWVDGWGNRVDYRLDDGTLIGNAHIIEGGILVSPGQRVTAGQVIAYAGTTGPSTGCHLHFMVNNGDVDPQPWLSARGLL